MEVREMLKKSVVMLFGLVFAVALITPPKANAEVVIGVGVGARPAYGYVAARPYPYGYIAPAPYLYPGNVVVGVGYARPYGYRYDGRRGYGWRR
jgi:hypothetical protein